MKKSIKRIVSFALMLSLLVGMMAGFSAFAAETETVEIISKNLYYGDTFNIMYAVNSTSDDVVLNIYTMNDEGELELAVTVDEYITDTVKGVENAKVFTSAIGVPAQNIDKEFYAQAVAGNTKSEMVKYSVLEYLYERLTVSEGVTAEQATMYNSLLAFADAADVVVNKDTTTNIAKYAYVRVTNGTVDGEYATAMVLAGTALDKLATTYVPETGKVLAWEIASNEIGKDDSTAIVKDESVAEYTVEAGKVYNLTAVSMESGAPVIKKLATFAMGTQTTDNTNGIKSFEDKSGDYTLTVTSTGGKMYKSVVNGDSALKFGASGTKGDGAIKVASNVTKVIIYVCTYNTDSTKLLVNGTEYALTSSVIAIEVEQPTPNAEWTVSFEAKNASKNRFYITSIEFEGYEI